MIKTTISPRRRFGAVAAAAVFSTTCGFAQMGTVSPEVRTRQTGPIPNGPYHEASLQIEPRSSAAHANDRNADEAANTVSVDHLRNPISEKARRMLQRAEIVMNADDHEGAIEQLRETLEKYPESAPYVHRLLGVEYMKTEQFMEAVDSLAQAASMLPHDALTHHNFGLSLLCVGDLERAKREVLRAFELNPDNPTTKALLTALLKD